MDFKIVQIDRRTHRLIPSRFPPIAAFEDVASAEDAAAVMELEGWTNDRLVLERVSRLPREQWIFGEKNASIVLASFLHASPTGMRFNNGELGAWYAAYELRTAIAEVAHHLRREAILSRRDEMRLQYREYLSGHRGDFIDVCGHQAHHPELYDPADYEASQVFGEKVRATGKGGILYDSVRHKGGINLAAYIPKDILDVTTGSHFEIIVPLTGRIIARTLRTE
ncbi:MAG: RES domain-containing protein [Rhodospirillaceae bacterium]|nr:MAG: RES domain-containing protein [Rhodospirillaceae bacterium]